MCFLTPIAMSTTAHRNKGLVRCDVTKCIYTTFCIHTETASSLVICEDLHNVQNLLEIFDFTYTFLKFY